MKFHDYQSAYETGLKLGSWDADLPVNYFAVMGVAGKMPRHMAAQLHNEYHWTLAKRPYYNMWPLICASLARTKLDVAGDHITLPRSPILLRFAQGQEWQAHGQKFRTILAADTTILDAGDADRGLCLWCDFGQRDRVLGHGFPVLAYRVFQLNSMTIEESLKASEKLHDPVTADESAALVEAVRLTVAVCLLGESSEFFDPDVLSKDAAKYRDDPRPEIVERAHRRGKIGWHVGRAMDYAPSVVLPYFAIRWMGHGADKTPVLRPVSGYVARRQKITEAPTGYFDA